MFLHPRKWLEPIRAAAEEYAVLIWSPLIITEVSRLLTWRWIRNHDQRLDDSARQACSRDSKRWFELMTASFRVVDDRPPLEQLWAEHPSDVWDWPVWTAAIRAKAAFETSQVFLVTENLRDGPPEDSDGVRQYDGVIYTHPEVFLEVVDQYADLVETGDWADDAAGSFGQRILGLLRAGAYRS